MFMFFIYVITQNINVDLDGSFSIDDFILFMLLNANDAVVFSKSPEGLQSILYDLDLYCRTWGLKINASKTKAMILKSRPTNYDFYSVTKNSENILEFIFSKMVSGTEHTKKNSRSCCIRIT